jgi:hypothetical protein
MVDDERLFGHHVWGAFGIDFSSAIRAQLVA